MSDKYIKYIVGSGTYYYKNNFLHREDGPAIESPNGDKFWCLNGKRIDCKTNEEFLKIVKYKWLL